MNRKAQNIGQIFIYIVAIVIVAVILIFGYKSIIDFNNRAKQIELVQFQKKLESSIKSITPQYATVKKKDFMISNEYKQVCFVRNYDVDYSSAVLPTTFKDYPLIEDSVMSGTGKNIFLIKTNKQIAESFEISEISFEDSDIFNCFNIANSRLSVKIEGKGDHVVIS